MPKDKEFHIIPMCSDCMNKCKKEVNTAIFKSFQEGKNRLYCSRFKKTTATTKKTKKGA